MHVVIVSRRFPPQIGGAEVAIGRLASGLAGRGNRVSVVAEARDTQVLARLRDRWPLPAESAPAVTIVPLLSSPRRFWGTAQWMSALGQTLRTAAGGCDLIYVSMLKHSAFVAMDRGRNVHVPVVLRPSGTGPTGDIAWQNNSWFGRIVRRRCRRADALVAVSPQMREELLAAKYPASAITPIAGGVPIPETAYDAQLAGQARRALPTAAIAAAEGPLAVYAGRFSREKGLEELIEAWSHVRARHADAQLMLVGAGPTQAELQQQVCGAGLEQSVHFCGAVHDSGPFLRAAQMFVLPSHQEGMSNALLEAMALGMPIVATDIAGNRSAAENRTHALLVPPGRSDALAAAILEVIEDPGTADAMGQAARVRAAEQFSIDRVLDDHERLFQELVAQ